MRIYNDRNKAFLADADSAAKKLGAEYARVNACRNKTFDAAKEASERQFAVSRTLMHDVWPDLSDATMQKLRRDYPTFMDDPDEQHKLKKLCTVRTNPLRYLNGTASSSRTERTKENLEVAQHYFWRWLMERMDEVECTVPALAKAHAEVRAHKAEHDRFIDEGNKQHALEFKVRHALSTMNEVFSIYNGSDSTTPSAELAAVVKKAAAASADKVDKKGLPVVDEDLLVEIRIGQYAYIQEKRVPAHAAA